MTSPTSDEYPPALRAVVTYGPDGPEIVRMDDQLHEDGPRDGTLELIRAITGENLPDEPFGPHEGTVYRFRDLTVVHCPDGDGGTVATYEGVGDRSSEALIEEVRSI